MYELLLHSFITHQVTCIYTVIPVSVLTRVNGTVRVYSTIMQMMRHRLRQRNWEHLACNWCI